MKISVPPSDRRLLELELNTWVNSLVTEMTDPGDELQASHPLRDARVVVEDIEDNPGFLPRETVCGAVPGRRDGRQPVTGFPDAEGQIIRRGEIRMKIYRPLWEDGAALAPQQFQQQARWDTHIADRVARMGISHPWGVVAAEFDDAALALSRLNASRLVVRFQDGTIVDTDLADNLPPVCDLSAANGSESVEVVVALPLLSASGGNLDNGQDRPACWKAERVVVQELAGYESGELAILRHAITLRLSTQENAAYLTCPVARLVRNAQGAVAPGPGFHSADAFRCCQLRGLPVNWVICWFACRHDVSV